jgi:hypothetical protein
MAAYENLPSFVGKIFKLSICHEKPSKTVVQKSIAKVSKVLLPPQKKRRYLPHILNDVQALLTSFE